MLRAFNAVAAALAVLLTIGLFHAKTQAEAARERVAALTDALAEAEEEVAALEAEVAHLESPARIEALARERLGLAPASPEQHVALPDLDRKAPVGGSAP